MVKVNNRSRRSAFSSAGFVTVSIAGMVFLSSLFLLWFRNYDVDALANEISALTTLTTTFSSDENADQIKAWRNRVRQQCQAATSAEQVTTDIGLLNKQFFAMPSARTEQPRDHAQAVRRCKRVVMDFGANIGDTSGKVIDAGMPACDRSKDLKTKLPFMAFNVTSKQFAEVWRLNPLVRNINKLMSMQGALLGPEDYCYYGVEGNPVFTPRLQDLEDSIMGIRPRPLQHLHFFTEHVGAGEDGITQLYLDTVNTKENFWGSSIFKDHQDVRKSAAANKNATGKSDVVAADVMGRTIGSLMRQTLEAFSPTATETSGNHLILKVDIEGGEYPLLFQAADEGTLCEFVKMGNTADLFIEFHSQRVTGRHKWAGKVKTMKEKLTKCGVTFRNLQAWWA